MEITQKLQERTRETEPGGTRSGTYSPEQADSVRWIIDRTLDTAWDLLVDAEEPGNRVALDRACELTDDAISALSAYRTRLDALRARVEKDALAAAGYVKGGPGTPGPVEQR